MHRTATWQSTTELLLRAQTGVFDVDAPSIDELNFDELPTDEEVEDGGPSISLHQGPIPTPEEVIAARNRAMAQSAMERGSADDEGWI